MSTRPRRLGLAVGILSLAVVMSPLDAGAVQNVTNERFAGANRYDTAARISADEAFASPTHVILASGEDANLVDSLSASGLAGASGRTPIVLTPRDTYSADARSALGALRARNGAIQVTIVGGTAAVSTAVEDAVRADGFTVVRAAGADRFKTAADAASKANAKKPVGTIGGFRTAIIASGFGNAASPNVPIDALAAGPVAYRQNLPVLLVQPNSVPSDTSSAISALGIQQVLIVGGTAAVSDAVETTLESQTGRAAIRLAGADRFTTATAVGDYAIATLGFPATSVVLANGISGVDALVGGPLGGELGAPLVLTTATSLPEPSRAFLDKHSNKIAKLYVPGGPGALDQATLNAAEAAAEGVANDTPTNESFTFAQGPATQRTGTATRTCSVSVPNATVVDLLLLPSSSVSTNASNHTLFADANSNNVADEGAVSAVITTVNGTDVTNARRVANTTSSGTVTFTISSTANEDVTVVAFADPASGNNMLDLVAPSTANARPKAPSEAFGTGCETSFVPAEAAAGTRNVTVTDVNRGLDFFLAGGAMYAYDSGDTFQFGGQALTMAQFEGALSPDDVLAVTYDPDASDRSTFNITTDDVEEPGAPATAVVDDDTGTALDDVRITATPSAEASPGQSYTVRRAPQTDDGVDNVLCNADDPAPADTAYANVGNATLGTDATTGAPQIQFVDHNVAAGCYRYRVRATTAAARTADSVPSAPVRVLAPADTTAPTVTSARAQDNGLAGFADSGDVHRFIFSEPMATTADAAGANYAVRDPDGTTASVVCGTGGTTCALNTSAVVIDGTSYAAGRILTVTLGTVTGTGGTATSLAYNLTVTAYSDHFEDVAGNKVTTAGDSTIQPAPFTSGAA